jgi:hypothetical protein
MIYTTTDGNTYTDATVACLIGASLATPALCAQAVQVLTDALIAGVDREALWRLSGDLVWGGVGVVSPSVPTAPQKPAQTAVVGVSDTRTKPAAQLTMDW